MKAFFLRRAAVLLPLLFLTVAAWALVPVEPTSLQKEASGQWMFEKVFEVPGVDRATLYANTRKWILDNVKSEDVNRMADDPKQESLVTTATLSLGKIYSIYSEAGINFKLTVDFKDGKMRISARSFTYYALATPGGEDKYSPLETYREGKAVAGRVAERIDAVFPAFVKALETGASKKSSDW